jgi:uncharacterized protein YndB with AHSA1/START domain
MNGRCLRDDFIVPSLLLRKIAVNDEARIDTTVAQLEQVRRRKIPAAGRERGHRARGTVRPPIHALLLTRPADVQPSGCHCSALRLICNHLVVIQSMVRCNMKQDSASKDIRSVAKTGSMDKIEKQVLLRAKRARVWTALTDIEQFCRWFGIDKVDGAFAPGARLHMVVGKEIGGGDFDVFVEQMQAERLFSWRWHPGSHDPAVDYAAEATTLVVFTLTDAPGGTLLTITESGFDRISLARRAKVYGENRGGWDDQAKRLERYVNAAS